MCDYSLVLITKSNEEKIALESVDQIKKIDGKFKAINIFGEAIEFQGEFEEFDSSNNKIIFRQMHES